MKKIKHFKSTNITSQQLWVDSRKHMKISRCLYPGCKNDNIINSHTLQNNGIISRLAVKNQVCMPRTSRYSIYPMDKKRGIKLNTVGKNVATTFRGFCKEHDDRLFADIEKSKWYPDDKSAFLFTYRTICSELQNKQEFMKRVQYVMDKKWLTYDRLSVYAQDDYDSNKAAINDLLRVKEQCDLYRENKEKDFPIVGIVLNMPKANFAVSGYYIPQYDFEDKQLNNKHWQVGYPVFVNIIPYKDKTIAFLTAYRDDYKNIYKDYFTDIKDLPETQKEIFLTNITIKSSDNLIINPNTAKKLTKDQIKLIEGESNIDDSILENVAGTGLIDLKDKGLNLFKI